MDHNDINFTHMGNFAGTKLSFALNSIDFLPTSAWNIDKEGSNQMCRDLNFFYNPILLKQKSHVFSRMATKMFLINS